MNYINMTLISILTVLTGCTGKFDAERHGPRTYFSMTTHHEEGESGVVHKKELHFGTEPGSRELHFGPSPGDPK